MGRSPPEHDVNAREHQLQLAPGQFANAFSELVPVNGHNQRDICDRILG